MSEKFWRDIEKAVKQVGIMRDRQIEIESEAAASKAVVVAAGDAILISIEEIAVEPPTLVVPS